MMNEDELRDRVLELEDQCEKLREENSKLTAMNIKLVMGEAEAMALCMNHEGHIETLDKEIEQLKKQ
jgi:hypothetical protein